MDDILSLTDLPRELRAQGCIVTYNKCWQAATEGRIPAQRMGRNWFVSRSDVPQIAAALSPAPAEQ